MAFTVSISTVPSSSLQFANQNFVLSATSGGTPITATGSYLQYIWIKDTVATTTPFITSLSSSINVNVSTVGSNIPFGVFIKSWVADPYDPSNPILLDTSTFSYLNLNINPQPSISISGFPVLNSVISFTNDNASSYFPNTVTALNWDFGDGNTTATTNLTSALDHTYTIAGTFNVFLSAFDVSGNIGVNSASIGVFGSSGCEAKENYITLCGPDLMGRFGNSKKINLTEYLPDYLKGAETEDFLFLFEDFLNNMFNGLDGWQTSSTDINISANAVVLNSGTASANAEISSTYDISGTIVQTTATDVEQIQLHWPVNASNATSAQKISILEKINRLTELHDPDLIDMEYIQFFASNLGYNVNVSRDEIGNSGTNDSWGTTEFAGECSAADINRYLRFVVQNLPTWYKIKTTRNSIKVMLYSFGLIGDIIEYFTDTYESTKQLGKWRADYNKNLLEIPNDWFPTPHFAIYVNFDESSDITFDISRRDKVIRAIESVRPINDVFRKLIGYVKRDIGMTAAGFMRATHYKEVRSDGYSNVGWGGW